MLWIEAQATPVITLLAFGVCYFLMAAIFSLAALLSRRAVAQNFKAITPVTLTPLGVVLGLLVVFLASRVWTNLDRARRSDQGGGGDTEQGHRMACSRTAHG